jgi:hypothetical protein
MTFNNIMPIPGSRTSIYGSNVEMGSYTGIHTPVHSLLNFISLLLLRKSNDKHNFLLTT